MFRTDLNHFLQAFDSPVLYKLMLYVSFLGTVYMVSLAVLILIGSVDFRKGFLVLNLLGWGVLVMLAGKNYADYPRPFAVDATLESYGQAKTKTDFTALQPTTFFERFSPELLAKIRANDIGRYGFPSGHVIIITVIWIGMALLFRKRWLWAISILLIVLTVISRMYLGLHYFGDVLGGLFIGVLLSLGFNILFDELRLGDGIKLSPKHVAFFLLPLVLLIFYNIIPGFQAGMLIGFNLALLLILKIWGEPVLANSVIKRVLNVLLFVLLYFSAYFLMKQLPFAKVGIASITAFIAVNFIVVVAFFFVGKKLGFYLSDNA
jgi:membrane-associated phospholipid phosphatase